MNVNFLLFFIFVVLPIFWLILLVNYWAFDISTNKNAAKKEYSKNFYNIENKGILFYMRKYTYLLVYSPVMFPIQGAIIAIALIAIYTYL